MLNSSIGLFSIYHPFQLNYPFVISLFLTRGLPVKMGLEQIEDAKVVIRSHKSKEDKQKYRQYNGQKKKDNHLQNTTQKMKVRATRTPLSHRLKKERQYNGQKKGTTRQTMIYNKGNNKITELRTILQRESQNS